MNKAFQAVRRAMLAMVCCIVAGSVQVDGQDRIVTATVSISRAGLKNPSKAAGSKVADASSVAVWLVPLDRAQAIVPVSSKSQNVPQLVQWHKTFEPHILIVPVGTMVEFPNKDPFFHNIFSLYDGRRFDLGLYESGSKRSVRFDRSGVSFLFCNIHAEMSAVVLSVETHYFALSDRDGKVAIYNVPDGRYQLNVWYERSSPEDLKRATRVVTINDTSRNLGAIQLAEMPNFTPTHKNKYGLDYVPPPNTDYDRP